MSRLRWPRTLAERLIALLTAFYVVMWAGGIASYVIRGGVSPGDEWTAPLFLGLAGLIVLASAPGRAAVVLLAGLMGFAGEWVGLRTGVLFGDYRYTDALSPKLLDVPIVMVSAWLVLIAYVDHLLRRVRGSAIFYVVGGASLLTAIDLIIDPIAAGPLRYWTWSRGGASYGIPVHNFAGWFVAGALILLMVRSTMPTGGASAAGPVGLSIVAFFTILAAAHGLLGPTLVGLGMTAVHALLAGPRLLPARTTEIEAVM